MSVRRAFVSMFLLGSFVLCGNTIYAQPTVTAITPSSGPQGTTFNATITGTNLLFPQYVSFSGTDVSATIRPGGTDASLPITINILPQAATGPRTVTVGTLMNGASAPFSSFIVNPKPLPLITTWGGNLNGQLGRSNPQTNFIPGSVSNLGPGSGTMAIASGSAHGIALKSDGTVLAWGSNGSGQIGDGTTTSRLTPTPATGLGTGSGVVAVAAGGSHNLALKSDGTVLAWGSNSSGQLGDGTTTSSFTPIQVSGLGPGSGVVAIAASLGGLTGAHSLALRSDGTVLAWGSNTSGQLGDGTTTQRNTPVQVTGLGAGSGVAGITAGASHSMARKLDGTLLAWGLNVNGQLGDGTTTARNTPVQVSTFGAGSGALGITAGSSHSMAVKSDGTAWAWGSNSAGQLGDGTVTQKLTPVQIVDPSGIGFLTSAIAIAAGATHSIAIRSDGSVLAWGSNSSGQLGDGTLISKSTPTLVSGLGAGSGTAKIAGGVAHSLALKSDGTALSWGGNSAGQLGNGMFDGSTAPFQIPAVTDVVAVSTAPGASHNLARKSDGTVLAWGFNSSGQLGDGTTTQRTNPVQVSGFGPASGVVTIAAGSSLAVSLGAHSLALKSDGTVWAWGSNSNGQLGDGTTTGRTVPGQVPNFLPGSGIIAIAGGASFSLALNGNGTVWAWGVNNNGQLGDGTLTQRTTPVQVSGFGSGSGVIAIAAGNSHAVALKSDGSVWTWGFNLNGQLGDGTTFVRSFPVQVRDVTGTGFLTGIVGIGAGGSHSLALTSDGTVWAWGLNTTGQLGDGTLTQRNTPVQVTNFGSGSGVTSLAGGGTHSLALKSDGAVWAWGSNSSGQLGDGSLSNRLTPVQTPLAFGMAIAAGFIHSLALAPPADTTPPTITPTITGTLGSNGWYRSDVFVTWTIIDPESGVASSTGCGGTLLATETSGLSLTCTAVNGAGLTASASINIKIDKTPPSVTFTRTAPNANGWNNGAVLVRFTGTDALSGISGPAVIDQTITTEGRNQSASATFTDLAGNTVTATANGINIDTTAPTLQYGVPSPAANGAGWNNTDVSIGFTTNDNLSGVISTSVPSPLLLTGEGSNVNATVLVTDAAGNTASFVSPTVKIDKTPPVAAAQASPLPNVHGWNNTDVTVKFTGTDSLSGVAGCTATIILGANGANQSASGACTDLADNVSPPATATGINIDKTPPTISGMPVPECTIWPLTRELVQIAAIIAADADSGVNPGSFSIDVTSNEPVEPSAIVVTGGVVQVRAARLESGSGRIYTVVARADDMAGNSVEAKGSCTVPRERP